MEIKGFAILNGMELIGKVAGETDYYFDLENTLAFATEQGRDGQMNLRLANPSSLSEDAGRSGMTLRLQKSSVIFSYIPNKEIEKQYADITGSIIKVSSLG